MDSSERTGLDELVVILDAAIMLQAETESVMRACVAEGPKGSTLARRGQRVTGLLTDLVSRAEQLPASPIIDDARGLLRYHHRILDETLQFAYSVTAILDHRPATPHFCDRLGPPGARLRRLRDLVAGYVGDGGDGLSTASAGTKGLPAQLSHSVRTALTMILGNASSLLQPDVDWDRASQDRFLRGIVLESARLTRVVDNILNLASMSNGTLRPDFDWCDPAEVIRGAVAEVDWDLGPERHIDVTIDLPEVSPDHGLIWADHSLLARALTNVLDNAVRHNRPDTAIRLSAATDGDYLTVAIHDDGQGLPTRVVAAVAGVAGTDVLPAGLGTGIPTTMGLLASHSGTVSYDAAAPGTRCTLRVPFWP
jgi:signal transduction histidine kinase